MAQQCLIRRFWKQDWHIDGFELRSTVIQKTLAKCVTSIVYRRTRRHWVPEMATKQNGKGCLSMTNSYESRVRVQNYGWYAVAPVPCTCASLRMKRGQTASYLICLANSRSCRC